MRSLVILYIVLFSTMPRAYAQYLQFSQYNFTRQRVNPASVGVTDYASASFLYRNQGEGGENNLHSSFMEVVYPLITRSGKRWSGLGLSVMDDRYGIGGIYNLQELTGSYAIHLSLTRRQSLSLGIKGLFHQRKVNLNGYYTGMQYRPGSGFDLTQYSGEGLQHLKHNYVTFSSGLYWQQADHLGHPVAYGGISFYDFNRPDESIFGTNDPLSTTVVVNGGFRIKNNLRSYFTPEFLYTRNAGNNTLNLGMVISYAPGGRILSSRERLDIITKYVIGRSGILGLQWHKENISFGMSYDFPVIVKNYGNTGSVEVAVELRQLVNRSKKSSVKKSKYVRKRETHLKDREKKKNSKESIEKEQVVPTGDVEVMAMEQIDPSPVDTLSIEITEEQPKKDDFSEVLQQKKDSVIASARAGQVMHQPLVLEKVNLHFNFKLNSSELDGDSKAYLKELAQAMNDNPELRIALTGHTDNTGSAMYNLRLSKYRAEEIRQQLIRFGVSTSRVTADGRGLTDPLNDNNTEEERAANRRVELLILYDY